MRARRSSLNVIIGALLLLAGGCSFFSSTVEQEPQIKTGKNELIPNPAAQVAIKELERPSAAKFNDIEITWKIPEQIVEGYLLIYGSDSSNLDQKIRLYSNEIETRLDPRFGNVYRYYISNIPANQPVFVQLVAFDGDSESEASEVYTPRD